MRSRLASAIAVVALGVVMLLQAFYVFLHFSGRPDDPNPAPFGLDLVAFVVEQIVVVVFAVLATVLIVRKPNNVMGWLFMAASLALSLGGNSPTFSWVKQSGLLMEAYEFLEAGGRISIGSRPIAADPVDFFDYGLMANSAGWALLILGLLLLFPTGRLPSKRWIPLAVVGAAFGIEAIVVWLPISESFPEWMFPAYALRVYVFDIWLGASDVLWVLLTVLCGSALVVRYRRGDQEQKHQIKWFALAGVLVVAAALLWLSLSYAGAPLGNETWKSGFSLLFGLSLLFLPVATGIAVLKYRLYDIDLFIRRTLLFGTLAAFITLGYVGLTAGLGKVLGARDPSMLTSLVATGLVSVAFQPDRGRAERLASRLVYGEQAEPYEVLAGLARRVGETVAADELLPLMAETAAQSVRATSATVRLIVEGDEVISAHWPPQRERIDGRAIVTKQSVVHQDSILGEIEVTKPANDPLRASEQRLLNDLASASGAALGKLKLNVELQRRLEQIRHQAEELASSRNRIETADVTAQLELERELRDRVESVVQSAGAKIAEAERSLENPDLAIHLNEAFEDARRGLEELREIAHGVFPPLLSEEGLVVALRSQIRRSEWRVRTDFSGDVVERRFDASTESAVYFCCVESMKRLSAAATESPVHLTIEGNSRGVSFAVSAQPRAFDMVIPPTVLQEMADRVEAVDGSLDIRQGSSQGIRIMGDIPAQPLP